MGPYGRTFAALATLSWSAWAAAQVSLGYEEVWEGGIPGGQVVTVNAVVDNFGEATRGTIRLSHGQNALVAPVDLPSGGRVVVPMVMPYGSAWTPPVLEVRTPADRVRLDLPEGGGYMGDFDSSFVIALIDDASGQLGALRDEPVAADAAEESWRNRLFAPRYVQPQATPRRSAAFTDIDMVILGDGAERLDDAAVRALQGWTLSGGRLVFTGGFGLAVLNDPRWRSVVPVQDVRVEERAASLASADMMGMDGFSSVPLAIGRPTPGATVDADEHGPILARKAIGEGEAVFVAFDPFEGAARTSGDAATLIRTLAPNATTTIEGAGAPLTMGATTVSGMMPVQENPFQVELPPVGTVASILLLYVIIVAPVNLLLLRKLGRGELAWITTPLIALGFSAIFFRFSGTLYDAGLSRATNGSLSVHAELDQAVFMGQQQFFFPSAGTYDLGFEGVEAAGPAMSDPYAMMPTTLPSQEFVDVGQVVAPSIRTPNLAFREFAIWQRLGFEGEIAIEPVAEGRWTLRNDTPYELTRVWLDGDPTPIARLESGASEVVEREDRPLRLQAEIKGVEIGSSIGEEVRTGDSVTLTYSFGGAGA